MKKIVDLAKDIFASKEQTAAMVLVHNVDGTHMAACGGDLKEQLMLMAQAMCKLSMDTGVPVLELYGGIGGALDYMADEAHKRKMN